MPPRRIPREVYRRKFDPTIVGELQDPKQYIRGKTYTKQKFIHTESHSLKLRESSALSHVLF